MTASTLVPTVRTVPPARIGERFAAWREWLASIQPQALTYDPAWLVVLQRALRHAPYAIEAWDGDRLVGWLPLCLVRSLLFGRFLVSMPYLNVGGLLVRHAAAVAPIVEAAVALAERLDVRYLELRHEQPVQHGALQVTVTGKVHMRLPLPCGTDRLWNMLDAKVRNQVRKGQKTGLTVHWGGIALLPEFYAVFSENMRDLGTPVFGRSLFETILETFADRAELCVVRLGAQAVAAALLLHGSGTTEVPSASSLRRYNSTCANMLMYYHLLVRSVERGQQCFDFGRSSPDSNTYRFKKQWGAVPHPAHWQYYVRRGSVGDMRPENGRYQRWIAVWRKLPVWLTRLIGPPIVRGIP